jgi:hypothetical protein
MMDFLFGAKVDKIVMRPESTSTLRLPVRVGIAFAPSSAPDRFVPETEQLLMQMRNCVFRPCRHKRSGQDGGFVHAGERALQTARAMGVPAVPSTKSHDVHSTKMIHS